MLPCVAYQRGCRRAASSERHPAQTARSTRSASNPGSRDGRGEQEFAWIVWNRWCGTQHDLYRASGWDDVIASLVTLPVATVADGADKVAPVTDKLTVISNGAPVATLTTTPPEGVEFSSVIATGKGAPGLALSHTCPRLARSANTLGGRAVRWLPLRSKIQQAAQAGEERRWKGDELIRVNL